MRVAITGATGFVGGHLVSRLEKEDAACTVLTRSVARAREQFPSAADLVHWDPPRVAPDRSKLEDLDAVIHLAGEPVAQRWTRAAKASIFDSRILSTETLVDTLAGLDSPPKTLVSSSAIGFYGPRNDSRLDEAAEGGQDFLADLCRKWEAAADEATGKGIRVVRTRVGIILGPDGGALSLMRTPFRLGAGGPIGNGRQWMSWVHIDDVVGLILHAIRTPSLEGPLNVTAPEPVRNKEFSKALGRALHRPAVLPTPVFALKLAYGEFADILATGQRVIPAKAEASGYAFRFPELDPALRDALER